jgi:hypothetical protein
VWDANSGKCLEVTRWREDVDVAAILAGGKAVPFPWQAVRQAPDTVIEPAAGGEPFAWFPVRLGDITAHPSGRAWAGSVDKHLYIIQLEGHRFIERDTGTS